MIDGPRLRAPIDTPMDLDRIEKAVRELLEAIGEDPERDGLIDTPVGVARLYAEIAAGLHEDPAEHLTVTLEGGHDEMVMVGDIPLYSLFEHHPIPLLGKAPVEIGRAKVRTSVIKALTGIWLLLVKQNN